MSILSKYWTMMKLKATGACHREEMASVKVFFASAFPELTAQSPVPDTSIQRLLIQWMRQQNDPEKSPLAEGCLLCFISHQIVMSCRQLEAKFGYIHGFTYADLLPFVLDDDSKISSTRVANLSPQYQSFARTILQSFDPEQSSLATWTTMRVKHHSELNVFLLERGLYLVSDWAILNDTTPKQIERIFSTVYHLTPWECQQASQLLESYHAVYRAARRPQRQGGLRRKCQPPNTEQLQEIAKLLDTENTQKLPPEMVMVKLQKMAAQLRQYRIRVRGGYSPTASLDSSEYGSLVNRLASPVSLTESDSQSEEMEFLKRYRSIFLQCLEQALARVTDSWVSQLQRKDAQKSQQFLTALQLFHCQGKSMGEMAAMVGLQAQYQVTRLLKLKSFRADVRQQLLMLLRESVQEQAKYYADPQRLKNLDQQIEEALNEQIAKVIQEAETEASLAKIRPQNCLFSQKLCHYLDSLRNLP